MMLYNATAPKSKKAVSLSQSLVSLHRLKAATKQLGREQERESDWGCGCYSNHLVGLNCSSLSFVFWHFVILSLCLSPSLFFYSHFCLSISFPLSLAALHLSYLLISLSCHSPTLFRSACLPLSRLPYSALLTFLGKQWETVFNVNAKGSFHLCLFGCLSISLTLSWHSHLLSLVSYSFQTRTIDEDSVRSDRIWVGIEAFGDE